MRNEKCQLSVWLDGMKAEYMFYSGRNNIPFLISHRPFQGGTDTLTITTNVGVFARSTANQ